MAKKQKDSIISTVEDWYNEQKQNIKEMAKDVGKTFESKARQYLTSTEGQPIREELRRRAYRNINPVGYDDAASRIFKGLVLNQQDPLVESYFNNPQHQTEQERNKQALWSYYLGHQDPELEEKYIEDSPYRPSMGKTYDKVVRLKQGIPDETLLNVIDQTPIGSNINARKVDTYYDKKKGLGQYTFGHGQDEKGKYVSYYDDWDLAPFGETQIGEDQSAGIGEPFSVYDRRYYTDEEVEKLRQSKSKASGGFVSSSGSSIKKWKELSTREKHQVMQVALDNGITNLNDIIYNWENQ